MEKSARTASDSSTPAVTNASENVGEQPTPTPRAFSVAPALSDMPDAFKTKLNAELHARGLITPEDFLKPGSAEVVRTALFSALKGDALDIIAYAKEHVK